MAPAEPEVRDLGAGAADLEILQLFYEDLYTAAFPDPDERESLANMKRYLELKASGWYGANNYHVRVLVDGGHTAAGSVSDYLAGPNTGVIEFLVVAPDARRRGLGGECSTTWRPPWAPTPGRQGRAVFAPWWRR